MNARERILRDNGLLTLAAALAIAGGVNAPAASASSARPLHKPAAHRLAHPDPHNFVGTRDAT
jgi:hypothetical protein